MQLSGLDIPFLVVSGAIDEEHAVAVLRAGAHDFVTKEACPNNLHNFAARRT